ncbi:hypothetical protein HBN50_14415 [Halobacteriovorax sp. GB3]|uniref:DUF1499 domain-containing protein n=1 Tax=Halobacteriovorax sp. GB3 TaxID=2719615 RepID=UPI00235EAD1A|nr:DUF1499 domain-containing protein [Halobacteriovorax sp. GB3]MDD0854303.1 hypothetical protein [Halobacteriovorax sp. GB3]
MKVLLMSSLFFLASCQMQEPKSLGPVQKEDSFFLAPCSTERVCLSSYEGSFEKIKPLGSIAESMIAFEKIFKSFDELNIVKKDEKYIYATYDAGFSGIFDLELLFEGEEINIKSQARAKYLTFNKGKKLLNKIVFKYYQRDY